MLGIKKFMQNLLFQNQIIDLINKQKIDIEARLLFGIINLKETI